MPVVISSAPSTSPARPSNQRRRRVFSAGGSGRLRIAVDDVHPAHAPGREGDDDQREQHADRIGDREARRLDRVRDGESPASRKRSPSRAPSRRRRRCRAARRRPRQRGRRRRPSNRNICTRWPRRVPTARAIPSSPRRSAASITKIRKISRIPAAIENEPNVVKNDMKAAPGLVGRPRARPACVVVRLEAEGLDGRLQQPRRPRRSSAPDAAAVRDEHAP